MLCERYYASGLGKFRISVTDDAKAGSLLLTRRHRSRFFHSAEAKPKRIEQQAALDGYFLSIVPELAAERIEIQKMRDALPSYPTTLIFKERPAHDPRRTFIHNRGEFLQPTTEVMPGVLSFLNPLPKGAASTTA